MGKTIKAIIIGAIVTVLVVWATIATGGNPTFMYWVAGHLSVHVLVAAAIVGGVMGGVSSLLAPSAEIKHIIARANVSVNPESPMIWAFGETAFATDAVWVGKHGTNDRYYSFVIACAGHLIDSYSDEIYVNGEIVTFSGDYATGLWYDVLWRQTNLGTETQAAFGDIDTEDGFAARWASTSQGKGMAHVRLRWDTKADKISSGVPTRVVIKGKGGPVYDPRLDPLYGDPTGTHSATDQTTWEYTTDPGGDDIGENWALIVLRYLLGWKLNGKLSIGMGISPDDIDMDQAIAAANVCEEIIDGDWRYKIGGILPVTNEHSDIIGQLEAAINGKVGLVAGKYYIWAPNDDLVQYSSIDEEDILREGGVSFSPSGPMASLYNTARGRYILTTSVGSYQLAPYPEVIETAAVTEDGGYARVATLDYPLVQETSIAQRVSRQYIRRSRFGATWKLALGPKGLTFQPFTCTLLNCQETNFVDEWVRIIDMEFSVTGVVVLELLEEDTSIYDTTSPLGSSMVNNLMDAMDPTEAIELTGLTVTLDTIIGSYGTVTDAFVVSWDDPGAFVQETHVQFKLVTDSVWINVPSTYSGFLQSFIYPLEPGSSYDIRARHVTVYGVAGSWVSATKTAGAETTLGGDTLFNSDKWVTPITNPMGGWSLVSGATGNSSMQFNTIGPFSNLPKTLRIAGDGTAPGWYSEWKHDFAIDDYTSYIVFCWVRNRTAATNKGLYIGWEGTVKELGGGDVVSPNVVADVGSVLDFGEWYLAVSILHSSEYVGSDVGTAGIYDPADGTKVIDGAEYRVKPGETSCGWSFGFYSNTTAFTTSDGWEFTRPMAYKVDGSEPTIETALNLAAITGKTFYSANVFLRKATAPSEPVTDDGQYDFSSRTLTPPSISGGSADDWYVTPPAGTDPLYISSALFETDGVTGIDTTCDWTAPQLLVSDGADGDAIAVVNAYLRKATTPTKPINNDGEYNFTTLTLTPPSIAGGSADDWSAVPPDTDGNPLWVTVGTFAIAGGTGIDDTVVWTTPQKLVTDGVDAVLYYIKPVDGTAIHDGVGVLQIEAHRVTGATDQLLSSGSIMLYDPSDLAVTVANGYATGSDGYTGYLNSGDINGDIVITLKDGPTGDPLDSITLVDIADGTDGDPGTDGEDAVFGYIEPSGSLAWTRDKTAVWSPTGTTVDLDCTFVKAGAAVCKIAWRITRDANGVLTGASTTHKDGDLNLTHCVPVEINESTKNMTVRFPYSYTTDAAEVAETVLCTLDGADGAQGDPGVGIHTQIVPTPNPIIPADYDGGGYDYYGTDPWYITGGDATFEVREDGVLKTGTNQYAMTDASNGTITDSSYVNANGVVISVNRTTGAILARTYPTVEGWTTDQEWVEITATYGGVNYVLRYTITKSRAPDTGTPTPDCNITGGSASNITTGYVAWKFDNDGDEYRNQTGSYVKQGDWHVGGTATDFEILAVKTYENAVAEGQSSGTFDTWQSLGTTDRIWTLSETGSSPAVLNIQYTIRHATTHAIQDIGVVTMSAHIEP